MPRSTRKNAAGGFIRKVRSLPPRGVAVSVSRGVVGDRVVLAERAGGRVPRRREGEPFVDHGTTNRENKSMGLPQSIERARWEASHCC